jgi:secondary thiamine-phosphate synthase enzyme
MEIQTKKEKELLDITESVEKIIKKSKVKNGIVNILTMHTSSGIIVTEGLPCLEMDILNHLDKIAPEISNYYHNRFLDKDGRVAFNASAHLKSIHSGYFASFPIKNGKIIKGSRQRIFFAEYDGPLLRNYCIQIIGK